MIKEFLTAVVMVLTVSFAGSAWGTDNLAPTPINGGIECNHKLPEMTYNKDIEQYNVDKTRRRADHFHEFADILGVGDQLPTRPKGYATNDEEWNTYYQEILEGCIDK